MLTSQSQPTSYSEGYERKRYSQRNVAPELPLPQGPAMLTDRGAYLNFLESQVDRVSAACMTVQGYEGRFLDVQTTLQTLETRCNAHTKLIALAQQCTEEVKADFERKLDTIIHTQVEEKKYQERALTQLSVQVQNIERTLSTLSSFEARIASLEAQGEDRYRQQVQTNLHTEESLRQLSQETEGLNVDSQQHVLRLDRLHANVRQLEVSLDEQKAHVSNYHQHLEKSVYEMLSVQKEELLTHCNGVEIKVHESLHQLQKDVHGFHEETLDSLKQHYHSMDSDMQQLKQSLEEELDEIRSRTSIEMDEKVGRSTQMLLQKLEESEQLVQQQVLEPLTALDTDMAHVYDTMQQRDQDVYSQLEMVQQQFTDLTGFVDEYVQHKGRFAHRAPTASTKNKKRDKHDRSESPYRSDAAYQSESSVDVRRRDRRGKSKQQEAGDATDSEVENNRDKNRKKTKKERPSTQGKTSSTTATEIKPKKSLFDEVAEFMTGKHHDELHTIESNLNQAGIKTTAAANEGDLRSRIRQVIQQSYPVGSSSGGNSAELYVLPAMQSPAATARTPNFYPPRPPSGSSLQQSAASQQYQNNAALTSSVDTDVAAGFFPPPSANRPPPFPLQESNPMNQLFSSFMEQYKQDQQALQHKLDTISLASSTANTPGRGLDNSSFVDQDCQVEDASFEEANPLTKLMTEYKKDQNMILERLNKLQESQQSQVPSAQGFYNDPQDQHDFLARYGKTHPGANPVTKVEVSSKKDKRSGSADSSKARKVQPTTTTRSILKDTDSSAGKRVQKHPAGGKGVNKRYTNEDCSYEEDDSRLAARENGNPNRSQQVSTNSRSRSTSPVWKQNNTFVPSARLSSRFKSPINGSSTNNSNIAGFESSLSLGEGSGASLSNHKGSEAAVAVCDVCHHPLHESRKDGGADEHKHRHRHHHHHHRHHHCPSTVSYSVDDDCITVTTNASASFVA